jgi:hypothetical protein
MLSIQKSPTDKTGLEHVASSSNIPSTSKTIFIKPTVPKPPSTCMDKGKEVIGGDILITVNATTVVYVGTFDLFAHFSRLRDQRSRSCQDKLHPALDLWSDIRLHSINGNNSDLFLPI